MGTVQYLQKSMKEQAQCGQKLPFDISQTFSMVLWCLPHHSSKLLSGALQIYACLLVRHSSPHCAPKGAQ